jgi:hypothetical protein
MQAVDIGRERDPVDLDADGTIEPDELAFADEDERLPWLEADDDFEENQVDTGRVVAFVVVGLLVLGLILGGIWLFFRDGSDATLVADGSTIEAPAEPYKTRPDDPGGTEAVGTGDTSFAVGEGQTRETHVATGEPRPSIDRNQSGSKASAGEAASSGGVGVQVGAYSSIERAQEGWAVLASRYSALDGVRYRVVQGTVDGGTIYRLQAVASDAEAASALCGSLRASGGDCQVKN